MYFSCDVTLEDEEGRVFEWVLFIRATSYAAAAGFAEQAIAERWHGTMRIEEMFMSPDSNSLEMRAARDNETSGVYVAREPREVGRHTPLLTRIIERLRRARVTKH